MRCYAPLQVFKDKIKEFRSTVQQLTGWRVDMQKENEYVLVSSYGQPNDTLVFQSSKKDGALQLLESEFATRLSECEIHYLQERQSIPACLSAVTHRLLG